MPVPEELKKALIKEFEKHLEAVRECPMTPGSLEPILTRAAQNMGRLTQEALAQSASDEADFPPSGLSPLPDPAPLQPADQTEASPDGLGPH